MRHLAWTALLTIGLVSTGVQAGLQTADEIIEKHLAALGGRPALQKLTSRRSTGTVSLSTQGTDISGPYEAYAKAPNKTRVVLKLDTVAIGGPGEMVIDQRFDGTNGSMSNSLQGDTVISGNQLENLRNGAFPTSLLNYKERGIKIDVLPREKVDGQELIVLQVTPKTGSVAKLYFDPSTYLMTKTVAKVTSPDQGDFEQTVAFADYRTVDGVKAAFQTVNSTPNQKLTVKIAKIEHNVPIDDAMFTKK